MDLRLSILALALCAPATVLAAQTVAAPVSTPAKMDLPSQTMQPSLDVLKQAIATIKIEKWKTSAASRTEAEANLASIRRDVETTLPPLLAAADAAPDSAAKVLPAYRNVEALYDVLLRVAAAGHLAAPPDQASALDQALSHLDDGRRALGDQLQRNAVAEDKQVSDLQASLKAIPPAASPIACTPATPAPAKKKAKPAPKPTPAPSN
jgi:hypothetical protein